MCLILLAYDTHPRYRLILAANRDEFYSRPTAPAAPWSNAPGVVAGRDLRSGGTWLGIGRGGRWAALTNVRDPATARADAPSRGHLVSGFLRGDAPPADYLQELRPHAAEYNGFNLLVGDSDSLLWYSNRNEVEATESSWALSPKGEAPQAKHRGGEPRELAPGVYGLSNHLLDTPWPKVERGKRALRALLAGGREPEPDALFRVLADRAPAADAELPDTRVGREWERVLSPPFIASPEYGTRASTVLLIGCEGEATLTERTFTPGANGWSEVRHRLRWNS